MPRSGVTVYLPKALELRIFAIAKERHCSASSLIADAVKARFDRKSAETTGPSERERMRTDARLDKMIGEALIMKEVLLLFVRVWLEHNPPIDPDVEESVAASAEARFERFLDFVARGLSPGRSIASRELITPALSREPSRSSTLDVEQSS